MACRVAELDIVPWAVSVFGSGDAVVLGGEAARANVLERYERTGLRRARVMLPFDATQPAVDAGGDRAYVAGTGVVQVDGERVAWTVPFAERARVTAFEGGELAVAHGSQLDILGPAGEVRQSFTLPAVIETAPAIDAHGDVWIATARAIFHLR